MKRRMKSDAPRKFMWKRSMGILILFGLMALLAIGMLFRNDRSNGVQASASPAPTPKNQKRYIATRPIVIDQQSGQLRMPTAEETDKLVDDLSELAKRPEDLPQTASSGVGVSIDLDGGYAGVMLGRPRSDGTFETRCVFTFEEGAEFLGLVEAPIE